MEIPSKLLENAVEHFSSLPGIGKKTALRLVLSLLRKEKSEIAAFSEALTNLSTHVQFCSNCNNLSDESMCSICKDPKRDSSIICIVEDIRDVMAIESTLRYQGHYHVLGGVISPINGIGPSDLEIEGLMEKCNAGKVKEVILALSPTMEGDTTNFFLYKKVKDLGLKISMIARGISTGDELEYADEVTLGRSIINRLPYESSFAD